MEHLVAKKQNEKAKNAIVCEDGMCMNTCSGKCSTISTATKPRR
ncbi:MAG: hypothetical protein RR636_09975 [Clostridium sp.]